MICRANLWAGFCMVGTAVMKELIIYMAHIGKVFQRSPGSFKPL